MQLSGRSSSSTRGLAGLAGLAGSLDECNWDLEVAHTLLQRLPRPGKGGQDVAQRVLSAAALPQRVVVVLRGR